LRKEEEMQNIEKYKKVGSVTGMVLLDTLVAGAIFYLLYYMFSIPLVWTALIAVCSIVMRSGLYDRMNSRD